MKALPKHDEPVIESIDSFLGQKLNDFRNKVGWTLSELGEKIGVSHQQIHKYEQGVTKLSANTLYKLSRLFNTSPNSFFEGFDANSFSESKNNNNDELYLNKKNKLNILLIEDNPADEFLVRKILNNSEYESNIFCLHDGEEVMDFLRKKLNITPFPRPDIILLDLNLPNVNGQSILRSLKQDRGLQDIPVLVITNSLSKKDMELSYKNYASGYMTKSFDFDTFQNNLLTAIKYWTETVILPS